MVKDDIKFLTEMYEQMKEQVSYMKEYLKSELINYELKFEIADELCKFTEEQVNEFTPSVLVNIYRKYSTKTSADGEEKDYDKYIEKIRAVIKDVHKSSSDLEDSIYQCNEIRDQIKDLMDNYTTFLNSDEAKEMKKKQVEELKKKIEEAPSVYEKNRIINNLKVLEESENLEFVFERIEKLSEKELNNIADTFLFNHTKSAYVVKHYVENMNKIHFNSNIVNSLQDIEINFLDEKYHVFNNLFLFNYIRFAAYSNMSDRGDTLLVQSLSLALSKLVFHRLDELEEARLIDIMKKFIDFFINSEDIDYVALFTEKNIYAPNSEHRIEKERMKKEEAMNNLKKWFDTHSMSYENMTYEEMLNKMHEYNKREELLDWLKRYEIEVNDEMTTDELSELVKSHCLRKPVSIDEPNEEETTDETNDIVDMESKFNELVDNNPDTVDTLAEVSSYITTHESEFSNDAEEVVKSEETE